MNTANGNTEIWRHFRRRFPRGYHVSNLGRIMGPRGIIRGEIDIGGYVRVTCGGKHYMAHRLVGRLFVSGFRRGLVINHKDGNKDNNKAENLEWVTQRQNIAHSWNTGMQNPKAGVEHYAAKLNHAAVLDIRSNAKTAGANQVLARRYGVSPATIHNVISGKTWKSV